MKQYQNILVADHPLLKRDLSILRNRQTDTVSFRSAMRRIATVLACFALKDLPLRETRIETPITKATGHEIDAGLVIVPILRAGLGMSDAFLNLLPEAQVRHLGIYRDEKTHTPVEYYSNLPADLSRSLVLLTDPMLATGGSADDAIRFLKNQGAGKIRFISVISAKEGVKRITDNHPDVPIITAAVDEELNANAFIVPGLGDAGDRYFGTT